MLNHKKRMGFPTKDPTQKDMSLGCKLEKQDMCIPPFGSLGVLRSGGVLDRPRGRRAGRARRLRGFRSRRRLAGAAQRLRPPGRGEPRVGAGEASQGPRASIKHTASWPHGLMAQFAKAFPALSVSLTPIWLNPWP